MKRILSMFLAFALLVTLSTGSVFAGQGNSDWKDKNKEFKNTKEFKDTKNHWGNASIKKMQTLGLLNGYDDGTFRPGNTLTQAELAVIIDRLVQKKFNAIEDDNFTVDDDEDLTDVPDWAKNSVKKGFEHKYLNLKRFHSHVQCDRLTAMVAIAKALGLEPADYTVDPFKDKGLIGEEDYGYLVALYEAGYIKGYPDGNFNPNRYLNRAEMAAILAKLLEDDDLVTNDETDPYWGSTSVVTASGIGANSVELKWTAASDNEKVVGYKVIYNLNGEKKEKSVSTTRYIKITGLEPNKEYVFTVEARDAAGNWSDDGPSVEVTTLEAEDTSKPTWPNNAVIIVSQSDADSVTLEWTAAEDNVAVTEYKVMVYLNETLIKTVDTDENEAVVSDLKENTQYIFKVKAQDEAGNWSSNLYKTYVTD